MTDSDLLSNSGEQAKQDVQPKIVVEQALIKEGTKTDKDSKKTSDLIPEKQRNEKGEK